MTITWSPPSTPNGILDHFTVYITYDNYTRINMTFGPTVRQYTLDGLSPYQTVTVQVSSSTEAEEGPRTTIEQRTTFETRM